MHLIAALVSITSLAALPPEALATTPVSGVAASSQARWFSDYDAAVAVAEKEGKDLLVDFSGSDWCHACIMLEEEVLQHAAWFEAASKDYVLVALDFPRGDKAKALVPNPKRNDELMAKYHVTHFPTVLLMTTDGVPFAMTGYQPGGPKAYAAHITKIATAGRQAIAPYERIAAPFLAAEDNEAKWTAWNDVVAAFNGMNNDSPFKDVLQKHVRWGFDNDKDNAAGKREVAARALLKKGSMDGAVLQFARSSDPKNENGLLELAVDAQFKSVADPKSALSAVTALESVNALGFQEKSLGFILNLTAARWFDGPLQDAEKKAAFAKQAMEIGTDNADLMAAVKSLIG